MSFLLSGLIGARWVFYWTAFILFLAAAVVTGTPTASRTLRLALLTAGAAALTAYTAGRWAASGRPPVTGTFENTLVSAVMVAALAIGLDLWPMHAARDSVTRLLAVWPAALLAYGRLFDQEPLAMAASARSLVGYVHAFIGWAAFTLLLGATLAAVAALSPVTPDREATVEEALTRLLAAGFAFLTATMVSGSIYSFLLFSEWYRWQVVETFAMAAWVAYALILHARLLFGWRGRRLAFAVLAAIPLLAGSFWLWSVYPLTYHYFERIVAGQ